MRRVIKLRFGERVPDGAKFLVASRELDHERSNTKWVPTEAEGIFGWLQKVPLFASETQVRETPIETFFYYEWEEKESE